MKKVSTVKLTIKHSTEKAYLTNECGWIPKSAVISMVGNDMIVEIAAWLVNKNDSLKENSIQAKAEFENQPKRSLAEIMDGIADQNEEKGQEWNPVTRDWELA